MKQKRLAEARESRNMNMNLIENIQAENGIPPAPNEWFDAWPDMDDLERQTGIPAAALKWTYALFQNCYEGAAEKTLYDWFQHHKPETGKPGRGHKAHRRITSHLMDCAPTWDSGIDEVRRYAHDHGREALVEAQAYWYNKYAAQAAFVKHYYRNSPAMF